MIQITLTRNLLGLEDLLTGVGTVEQTRGNTEVEITRINAANFPYDDTYTLDEKLTEIKNIAESLSVVDDEGVFLTGYLNTSDDNLDLDDRLWRKTPSANVAELWYEDVRILRYNRLTGDLIIPDNVNYIAADTALEEGLTLYIDTLVGDLDTELSNLSASLGTVYEFDVGTSANNIVQLDGDGKLPAVDGSNLTNVSALPVGAIVAVPYSAVDTNFLECNGQAVSRDTYSALFAKLGTTYGAGNGTTTFNIPDYRGEFLRGWDNGRGVDSGRTIGSSQSDQFKAHTHTETKYNFQTGDQNGGIGIRSASPSTQATGSTGGSETRPRNLAVMYQIKAL